MHCRRPMRSEQVGGRGERRSHRCSAKAPIAVQNGVNEQGRGELYSVSRVRFQRLALFSRGVTLHAGSGYALNCIFNLAVISSDLHRQA